MDSDRGVKRRPPAAGAESLGGGKLTPGVGSVASVTGRGCSGWRLRALFCAVADKVRYVDHS